MQPVDPQALGPFDELVERRVAAALDAPSLGGLVPTSEVEPGIDASQPRALGLEGDDGSGRMGLSVLTIDGAGGATQQAFLEPATLAESELADVRFGLRALARWRSLLSEPRPLPGAAADSGATTTAARATETTDQTFTLNWWIEDIERAGALDMARAPGFVEDRRLLKMRAPLVGSFAPPSSSLDTRAYVDAVDAVAWMELNNEAFSWHPEQSGMTRARLDALLAEPWVNLDGFRVLDSPTVSPDPARAAGGGPSEGSNTTATAPLDGFCFNKLHPGSDPLLGEIYVIAVGAHARGRGLGRELTLDGLGWMRRQGAEVALLYVEADNTAAVATYEGIGFTTHRANANLSTTAATLTECFVGLKFDPPTPPFGRAVSGGAAKDGALGDTPDEEGT